MSFQPISEEFIANTEAESIQIGEDIVPLVGGGFLIHWIEQPNSQDPLIFHARVFGSDGTPISDEIELLTSESGNQPEVTALATGGFAFTWTESDSDDSVGDTSETSDAVMAGVFNENGEAVTDPFRVNTAVVGDQNLPSIASLRDGGFVVTWTDYSLGVGGASGDTDGAAVKAQIYTDTGGTVGSEFLVNQTTEGDQGLPVVVPGGDGRFAVLWYTVMSASAEARIRVFEPDGSVILLELPVTGIGLESGGFGKLIALAEGGFAFTWFDVGLDSAGEPRTVAIHTRVLTEDGDQLGPPVVVNTTVLEFDSFEGDLEIVPLDGGGYAILWRQDYGDSETPDSIIRAQIIGADGRPEGDEIVVHEAGPGFLPLLDAVDALPGGGFVASWTDIPVADLADLENPETNSEINIDIKAKAFGADGAPLTDDIVIHSDFQTFRFISDLAVLPDGRTVFTWLEADLSDINNPSSDVAAVIFSFGPEIVSDGGGATAALTVDENGTAATTVVAEDVNTPFPSYAIIGGVDAAHFAIDPITGELTFVAAPDFEMPSDGDGNNVYEVEVSASDGDFEDTQLISVTVANEAGQDIDGTKKKDKLTGTGEEDQLSGFRKKDKLNGQDGDDILDGGRHKDKLTGGFGEDSFVFSTKLKAKWADTITDFEIGVDTIVLDSGIFRKLAPGDLDPAAFDRGRNADDSSDRIIHHRKSGEITYDRDGSGKKKAILFAKVDKKLDLSADDFLVI